MSHFSRIKTKVRDRKLLTDCLMDMGYQVREGGTIQGYQGRQNVDLAASSGRGYEIGFVADEEGCLDMVADWWGVREKDRRAMEKVNERITKIQKEYAIRNVIEQTKNQGFSVVEQNEESDGSVRIVVRRWV